MRVLGEHAPQDSAVMREIIYSHTGRLSVLAGMLATAFVAEEIEVVVSNSESAPLATHVAYYLSNTFGRTISYFTVQRDVHGDFSFSPYSRSKVAGRPLLVIDDISVAENQTQRIVAAANTYGRVVGVGTLITHHGTTDYGGAPRIVSLSQSS